ncbi:hypothetical protein D3C81_1299570 [compost metagenome]
MRGNDRARRQRQWRPCQQVQGVGIPHLRQPRADDCRQQATPPGRLAEAGADHHDRRALDRGHQLIGRMHTQTHHLRQPRQSRRHLLAARGQRNQPGATTQRGFGAEQNRSAGTTIAANHQDMAEITFLRRKRARREGRQGNTGEDLRLVCRVFGLRHGSKAPMSGRIIRT